MTKRIHILTFLVIAAQHSIGFAQKDFFLSISNTRSTAIAMGGAVTAVENDLSAISYNPGTFSLLENRSQMRLMVHINPILPILSYRQPGNFRYTGEKGFTSVFGGLYYLIKGLTFSAGMFDFGILFNEENFIKKNSEKFFDSDFFADNVYHTAIVNAKLSSQVSLGIAGSLIRTTENNVTEKGAALSYGILVKPSRMYQVGITYFDFSDGIHNFRRRFDRLADESLNAGLAIFPWQDVIFSVDVRNLTESGKPDKFGLQEFHFGFETTQIRHITLHGGFYREKYLNNKYSNIFTAGIGLIDLNRFRSIESRFNHPTPVISYTILFENTPDFHFRWHLLTIGFRI